MSKRSEATRPTISGNHINLQADCESCFGLCCVALPFAASSDFANDKAAGQVCHNLQSDFRCGVHANLRQLGYRGCTVYDCFGAGQKVSQFTFRGRDWLQSAESSKLMYEVYPIMRQLHELLWYLTEALNLQSAHSIHDEITLSLAEIEQLTELNPDALIELDIPSHRANVNSLLLRASELARATLPKPTVYPITIGRGADLMGAKLRGADLRGANLRGAYLIAADLKGADLRGADLIGADCRDTNFSDANLTGTIFLSQSQLNAAKGNSHTKLPLSLSRPSHW